MSGILRPESEASGASRKAVQLRGHKRQYRCAVTSEMCQLKALAVTKELGIMGFKATLCLCQVAAGKLVPIWLVAGIGTAWQRFNHA